MTQIQTAEQTLIFIAPFSGHPLVSDIAPKRSNIVVVSKRFAGSTNRQPLMISWKHVYFASGGNTKFAFIIRNLAESSKGCFLKHSMYSMQPSAHESHFVPIGKFVHKSNCSGHLYIGVVTIDNWSSKQSRCWALQLGSGRNTSVVADPKSHSFKLPSESNKKFSICPIEK